MVNLQKSLAIAAPYSASPDYTPSLGVNLEGLSYYSAALPMLDLMTSAGALIPQTAMTYDTGDQLNLDSSGWVTSIPQGADYDRVGITILGNNSAAPPNTDYVVLYDGEGTIQGEFGTTVVESESSPGHLVVQSAADGSLDLQILSTDPNGTGDYIRDIHVVREDLLPLYEAGETFNPAFLDKIDNFHTLRFMEWMDTNQVFDQSGKPIAWDPVVGWANVQNAPQLDWSDRPKMTDAQWDHGVPVEALVQAANEAGTDVWFNMPINASDDYIRQFATYVRDNLRPDLKIHVELSNEVWNFTFPQAEYALGQAQKDLGPNANWVEWYGMRTAQMGQIWKDVFGEPETGADTNGRVSVVFATQFANEGLEYYGLNTPDWVDSHGNHIEAANYFNEYAITGYYGDQLSSDANVATVKSWWSNSDGGYTAAIAAMQDQIENYNIPHYQYHAKEAATYGLKLVTYESGYAAAASIDEQNDTAYVNFLISLQRDPRIYQLEQENYAAFENAGGTLYNNFDAISAPSKFGSWGALESVNQTTSPRYQALTDWNANNPPWYETGRDPITFQNARIYQAGDGGEVIAGTQHGDDVLVGGAGNDVFVPYGSGSTMDGGTGFNIVVLPGALSDYSFVTQSDGSIIATGDGSTFRLIHIEEVIGNDGASAPVGTGTAGVVVTSVTTSGNGITAGSGDVGLGTVVTLTVNMSGAVSLTGGTPTLLLNDGGVATYTGGSGTSALTFSYTIGSGENTPDLTVSSVNLNGATLTTVLPTTLIGPGPTPGLSGAVGNPDGTLQIETPPIVTAVVTSGTGITNGNGNLGLGDTVVFTVDLNKAVNVFGGVPDLKLNDGGIATFTGGSGTSALSFTYTVTAGQSSSDLAVTGVDLNGATIGSGTPTITSSGTGSLTDANGHVFSFGAIYLGSDHYILRDGLSHGVGSELLLINGTLWDDSASFGWYEDNNGTWVYQSGAPHTTPLLVADLSDAATNPAGVLQVDPPAEASGPSVTSVVASGTGITNGSGDVGTGAVVTLTVNMSEAVNVTGGKPTLDLNDGGVATYTGGSGTSALTFTYTVAAGEHTPDLAVTGVHLNNATVETGNPTITGGSTASLTDANGHVFSFGAVYQGQDYTILRDGISHGVGSTLELVKGIVWDDTSSWGWYSDNNGSWSYQTSPPPSVATHVADLSGVVGGISGTLEIDTTQAASVSTGPVVSSVTTSGAGISNGTGDLGVGATITLTLNMSDTVVVSGGVPTLSLSSGGTASFASGSGTHALIFTYTVAAGDSTPDLTVTGVNFNNATVATGIATLSSTSSGSLTDANGHVFTFGAVYHGTDHFIFRDGVTDGAGSSLALVNGVVWDDTASYGWYADHSGTWAYQPTPPPAVPVVQADLSGAIANPAGTLHIDTTTTASATTHTDLHL